MNTRLLQRPVTLLLVLFFAIGLFASPAQAQPASQKSEQGVRTMLEQRDKEIKTAIKPLIAKTATAAQRKKVENLINDPIDFEEMGRRSLGRFWKDLSATQRKEFVDVFATIVRSQSMADLDVYNSKVAYEEISVVGDSAYVKTTTTYKDKKTTVAYMLGWHHNTWNLYDIILDGVGTVDGYARSFQSVLRKKDFDTLMKSLYKKRDKVLAKNADS